ncbi:hypothetical protein LUZ60_006341 [Juncus effusus]|nr:hypothetical protein LUZ60_006341 [Juncus effusus]
MAPPAQPKRRRLSSPSLPSNDASSLEKLLESVLAMSDPSAPLDLSLERVLESKVLDSDKEKLIDAASKIGSALLDAVSRSARKLAAAHNSIVWPLPPELTLKVLSCLDTTSLCCASATCATLSKCASDPFCYSHIDLTQNWRKVTNSVVSTMIQRAGKNLKSLKLGTESILNSEGYRRERLLTRTCLAPLSFDNGAYGGYLQKLSLNRVRLERKTLIKVLSSCKSLVDLEIVRVDVGLEETLKAVSVNCTFIERLCFAYSDFYRPLVLDGSGWKGLVKNCNKLTSLSIKGCGISDRILLKLIKGLSKLKYMDISDSEEFTGSFLRNFGNGNGGGCDFIETLILRDCPHLRRDPIDRFLDDILAGKWKSLRLLDISSTKTSRSPCGDEVPQLFKERRPEICLIAESCKRDYMSLGETSSSSDTSTSSFDTGGAIISSSTSTSAASLDASSASSSSDSSLNLNAIASSSSSTDDDSSSDDG